MKISVLINNYNYAQFLHACIDSVLHGENHEDFEIIVVDDGSTDGSRTVIESYGDKIIPVLKPNGGQASSFNAGFAASSGDILCMLDADDAFLPGKLRTIAKIYNERDLDWCFDRVTNDGNAAAPLEPVVRPIDMGSVPRQRGFPSLPVPTSGLTFHRRILCQILPMPVARDVVLSDNYLKFAAFHLGSGAMVETPLTFQRLHESNRYTGADKAQKLRSKIMIETGLQLARRYSGLRGKGLVEIAGGLSRSSAGPAEIWSEIRRCTRDGTFGPTGLFKLSALIAAKRALGKTR